MNFLSTEWKTRKGRVLGLALCFAMAVSLNVAGQVAGTASLAGKITDPTGAVIVDAEVTATHAGTGTVRSAKADQRGRYLLAQLPPGTYKIEFKATGFKTGVREKLELAVGITTSLDVELKLGSVEQIVQVESEFTGVNVTDASLGRPLSGSEVQSLPALSLNPAGLLSLQTGVTVIPGAADNPGGYGGSSEFDGRSGSVNGARSDQTNITLDGVDVNDPQKGFAFTSVLRVTQASLAEFRTTTSNYGSDAGGRSSAAQVQLVTRSGGNRVHGQAYYTHRNEALNANDFFLNKAGVPEPKFRQHLYGAALGGPIWKDRFFLFGNWERMQESLFASALRDVPSLAMRDGVFIYQCQTPDQPLPNPQPGFAPCPTTQTTVMGLSGATYTVDPNFYGLSPAEIAAIDPLGIGVNPAVTAQFASYGLPNDSGQFDGINIVGHRFGAPVTNTFNTYIARADFNFDTSGRHTFFWRGTLMDDTINTAPQFAGLDPNQSILVNSKGFALGYTAVLKPTLINNFRYGLTRISEQTVGNRNAEFVDFRFISNLNIGDFGDNNTFGRIIPQHHFRDDVTWVKGQHSFSFGGEARFTRNAKFTNANSFHTFLINPSWLPDGGSIIDPGAPECVQAGCFAVPANIAGNDALKDGLTQLLGPISQVDAFYNFDRAGTTQPEGDPVARRFAVNEYELYFQDQWRAFPSLTLTFGLRYVLSSPPWETNGNQVVPTPRLNDWFSCREQAMLTGLPTSSCGLIELDLGGPANDAPGYYEWDKNNWSPRVAFAWSPRFSEGILGRIFGDGKLVIRGGYSLVYDRIGNALATTFDEVGSFGLSTNITSLFGGCGIGPTLFDPACVRFTGISDTAAATAQSLVLAPPPVFPATPLEGLLTVTSGLDDKIRTPYSHTFNLTFARELPGDLTIEASYVGRRGRKLPIIRDYAMPADYCEPLSGVCAFAAARELIGLAAAGQDILTLGAIPFWENLFPGFGPAGKNGGCLGFDIFGVDPGFACGFSATQVAYDYMIGYHGTAAGGPGFGTSTVWQDTDYFDFPAFPSCAGGTDLFHDTDFDGMPDTQDGFLDCPNLFFPSQYVNLHTWTTIARSEYHAIQLNVRKRMSKGLLFNFNYTLSKSLDHSSTPERQEIIGGFFAGGYSGTTINAWDLEQEYSYSDFDIRHQMNSHWIWDLPFGRDRAFARDLPGWANQIFGGWQLSGIVRINSGVPAGVVNGRTWPTNWDLQGNATCAPVGAHVLGLDTAPCPATQNVNSATHAASGSSSPNIFADPDEAFTHFRFTETGFRGGRNVFRADGYFSTDLGIAKTFNLPWEGHFLKFRWDIFNLTNTPYFDAVYLNLDIGDRNTFGDYTQTSGGPRLMQFSLRYEF